jgi:hypothetical protein
MNKSKTRPNPKQQNTNNEPQHMKAKWATFTYSGKETKLFKDTHIKVAYRTQHYTKTDKTTHTMREIRQQRHLPTKMPRLPTKIHWPNRQNIPHQVQRTHVSNKNNNGNLGCSNHILNSGHKYGPITDIMDIIKTQKKGITEHSRKILHIQIVQ